MDRDAVGALTVDRARSRCDLSHRWEPFPSRGCFERWSARGHCRCGRNGFSELVRFNRFLEELPRSDHSDHDDHTRRDPDSNAIVVRRWFRLRFDRCLCNRLGGGYGRCCARFEKRVLAARTAAHIDGRRGNGKSARGARLVAHRCFPDLMEVRKPLVGRLLLDSGISPSGSRVQSITLLGYPKTNVPSRGWARWAR